MADRRYFLSESDRVLVVDTISRVRGSGVGQIPLMKRGRYPRSPAGKVDLRYGIVTAEIDAATFADPDVTPGTGEVQFYDRSGATWVPQGDPETVHNGYFDVIPIDTPVFCNGTTLVNAGCSIAS